MSKTAQLVGKDLTISVFLPRFAEMCTDGLFHVRKVPDIFQIQIDTYINGS